MTTSNTSSRKAPSDRCIEAITATEQTELTDSKAAELTELLHKEKKLPMGLVVRLRPLFRDFDIVNEEFMRGADMTYQKYVGSAASLKAVLKIVAAEWKERQG